MQHGQRDPTRGTGLATGQVRTALSGAVLAVVEVCEPPAVSGLAIFAGISAPTQTPRTTAGTRRTHITYHNFHKESSHKLTLRPAQLFVISRLIATATHKYCSCSSRLATAPLRLRVLLASVSGSAAMFSPSVRVDCAVVYGIDRRSPSTARVARQALTLPRNLRSQVGSSCRDLHHGSDQPGLSKHKHVFPLQNDRRSLPGIPRC